MIYLYSVRESAHANICYVWVNLMSTILSDDPADLFSQLYVRLDDRLFDTAYVFEWMEKDAVRDIAELIEERVVVDGNVSAASVQDLLDQADEDEIQERTFAILLGLDRALAYANPFLATHDQAGLLSLAVRYAATGFFNTPATATCGALVPRCAWPESSETFPNRLPDVFSSVVQIPPEAMEELDYRRIPARHDCTPLSRDGPFGFVALLDSTEELAWHACERHEHRFYRIGVKDTPALRRRIDSILTSLDQSGVTLGLIPELTLNRDLLEYWRGLVVSRPAPPNSRLKWVLVGSGALTDDDPPVNEAAIIDRVTGEVVLSQRKRHRFTLTPEQLRDWGLVELLGSESITEDLTPASSLTVIESNVGRITILVCEDLAQLMELGPWIRDIGVSHIFSPVFSKETLPHHWEHVKAKEYANEVGSVVAVVNSLVVARSMGEDGRVGCFLLHAPHYTRLGYAESPGEVCVLATIPDTDAAGVVG